MQQDIVLPTCGRVSTKGSCDAEDEDEEDTDTAKGKPIQEEQSG